MVVTRVLMPHANCWKRGQTEIRNAVVGPKGFTGPVCRWIFAWGKISLCMKAPDGQEFWNR